MCVLCNTSWSEGTGGEICIPERRAAEEFAELLLTEALTMKDFSFKFL